MFRWNSNNFPLQLYKQDGLIYLLLSVLFSFGLSMRWENCHYLSYLFLFFFEAASHSFVGAGMWLVVDYRYCGPVRVLFTFLIEVLGGNSFHYTIIEGLHASVFFSIIKNTCD